MHQQNFFHNDRLSQSYRPGTLHIPPLRLLHRQIRDPARKDLRSVALPYRLQASHVTATKTVELPKLSEGVHPHHSSFESYSKTSPLNITHSTSSPMISTRNTGAVFSSFLAQFPHFPLLPTLIFLARSLPQLHYYRRASRPLLPVLAPPRLCLAHSRLRSRCRRPTVYVPNGIPLRLTKNGLRPG